MARAGFVPSSNLAEVSDWLTKLLLGAGLVNLTHLAPPMGQLIRYIGAGLQAPSESGGTTPAGPVMAGAILFTYTTLGFLVGYILTTTWYQSLLEKLIERSLAVLPQPPDRATPPPGTAGASPPAASRQEQPDPTPSGQNVSPPGDGGPSSDDRT